MLCENFGRTLAPGLLEDDVLGVHELEQLRRCAQRLLKTVIENGKLAHRIVHREHGRDESDESAERRIRCVAIRLRPRSSNRAIAIAPNVSISGELMAAAATDRRLARKQALRRLAESRHFPRFHAEGLHDAVAGDGLMQNVLHVGQLVLPACVWSTDAAADAHGRENDDWDKQQQHPGQLAAQNDTRTAVKINVKNCCRNSASTLDMANCTRSMSLMMVEIRVPVVCFWKKRCRPPQDRVIQVIAQVGDHAETGVVHQVGAA
jgi:hypothetical protein